MTSDILIDQTFDKEKARKIQDEAEINGKCDFTLELELKTSDGSVVADFTGIWQIRKVTKMLAKHS